MYNKQFIIINRATAESLVPDWVEDLDLKAGGQDSPALYAIVFELIGDPKGNILSVKDIDVQRFAPAMSPQEWLIMNTENTLGDWLLKNTKAVYQNEKQQALLSQWVVDHARRYEVRLTVSDMPYPIRISSGVIAQSEEEARDRFHALNYGVPICFGALDSDSVSEIGWAGGKE